MRNSKRIKIVAGGTAALFGIGIAYAAWTSTGEGSGEVSSTTDQGLTVTSTNASGLFPTGSQTITVTVENKNPYKVALDTIDVDGIVSDNNSCNVGSVTADDKTGLTTVLDAASGTNDSATFDFVVAMSNDANDACQDNTFTVDFVANGHSSN